MNGNDWTKRYPRIAEEAARLREPLITASPDRRGHGSGAGSRRVSVHAPSRDRSAAEMSPLDGKDE
jgi:hypothetical protein